MKNKKEIERTGELLAPFVVIAYFGFIAMFLMMIVRVITAFYNILF